MINQQLKAFLISYGRLFAAGCIAAYFLVNKSPLELDFADGKVILAGGISALIIAVGNALNPADQRYGIGAPRPKTLSAGDVATNTAGHANPGLALAVCAVCLVILVLVALFGSPDFG